MRAWVMRLATLLGILALPGCVVTSAPPAAPPPRWWQALGDAPLSELMARARPQQPAPISAEAGGPTAIVRGYVDLRAQQSALVLLAEREELDRQLVAITRSRLEVGPAEAQLAQTRSAQAETRAAIAALRDRLAVLAGAAPGTLAAMPGGPIPLPPRALLTVDRAAVPAALQDAHSALARYGAARITAGNAQAQAEQARAVAALQTMRARAGILTQGEALDAERRALAALQREEQARTAMTQAYVALAKALGLGWDAAAPVITGTPH